MSMNYIYDRSYREKRNFFRKHISSIVLHQITYMYDIVFSTIFSHYPGQIPKRTLFYLEVWIRNYQQLSSSRSSWILKKKATLLEGYFSLEKLESPPSIEKVFSKYTYDFMESPYRLGPAALRGLYIWGRGLHE